MKVILFGGSGMVGQAVLRECLSDPRVEAVLSVGRRPTGLHSDKLQELLLPDVTQLESVEPKLAGYDACFFCLGVSSVGMKESDYRRVTYDLTTAVAQTLVRRNPSMTFVYVSGAGTDSTGQGSTMWARVKGQTENALLAMGFRGAYMFRPGIIRALHGIRSRSLAYRFGYVLLWPFITILRLVAPDSVTTTELVGRAMIHVALSGAPDRYVNTRLINALGRTLPPT